MFKKPVYPEVEPVVLKPFKGIRPGVYILIILVLSVLAILFVIGLLPGIVSSDSYVSFSSPLSALAVYEDGTFLGNAEGTVLRTSAGNHSYSYRYEGVEVGNENIVINRHFFFTLFAHRVQTVSVSFGDKNNAFEKGSQAFAESVALYSAIVDYDRSYNYPPLFRNIASDTVAFGIKDISDLWLYGALHVTSKEMYLDYLNGKAILEASNSHYTSEELKEVESTLDLMFGSAEPKKLTKKDESTPIIFVSNNNYSTYEEGYITLGQDVAVTYPETNLLPTTVSYDGFSIANAVVTEYDYAVFVNANPEWEKANVENLKAEGLVDDYYLGGITLTTAVKSKRPIRNVSYYAAKAYVEWLSKTRGVEYALPTEAEWAVAAKSASNKPFGLTLVSEDTDTSAPIGMLGQLWEFTDTPYLPLSRICYEKAMELAKQFDYDDIVVKGGSYANADDGLNAESVGVLSKDSCSDFCGIRVVMK